MIFDTQGGSWIVRAAAQSLHNQSVELYLFLFQKLSAHEAPKPVAGVQIPVGVSKEKAGSF